MRKLLAILSIYALMFSACRADLWAQGYVHYPYTHVAGGISFVQAVNVNQPSSTTSIAVPITGVVAGHQLIVGGWLGSGIGTPTCSDGSSSTYTSVITGPNIGSALAFECHTLNSLGSGSVTVTVTLGGTTFGMVFVEEWSGIASADQNATGSATATTSWTWPSVTNTATGVTLAFGGNGGTNATYTAASGYTIPTNGQASGGNQSGMAEYKATSSGSQTPAATVSGAISGSLITVSYK